MKNGRISEAIACGTAAVVTGIRTLFFENGSKLQVKDAQAPGPITCALFERLQGIQYGRLPDTHGWVRHAAGAGSD